MAVASLPDLMRIKAVLRIKAHDFCSKMRFRRDIC
jgi:hypothetical protein